METFRTIIDKALECLENKKLKGAIQAAFDENSSLVEQITTFWEKLPESRLDEQQLSTLFNSWKASHLKMLAIYGLSCRLQRLGMEASGAIRDQYFLAGALNAETSYEDLGLDYEGHTHAALFNEMVAGFMDSNTWPLDTYTIPSARSFKEWIYQGMVVGEISKGLFTNMFSEIFNHAEYSIALRGLKGYLDSYSDHSPERKEEILIYVSAHIEDDTELDHFNVVVKAIAAYEKASGTPTDYAAAKAVCSEYLQRIAAVMQGINQALFLHAPVGH